MPTAYPIRSRIKTGLGTLGFALLLLAPAAPSYAAGSTVQNTIVATVDGLACPFCAYGVRKELLTIPGVKDVQVNLLKSQAIVSVDPGTRVTDAQIQQAVREAGFSSGTIKHE